MDPGLYRALSVGRAEIGGGDRRCASTIRSLIALPGSRRSQPDR